MWFTLSLALNGMVAPVRVWDNIFAPHELTKLATGGAARSHSFTSVWDRETAQPRTVIETALCSVLDEIGDDSRYVEYWYRGVWKDMETHRDIDEALARSRKIAGTDIGVQRCPQFGHVLYLDVAEDVRGPTCVWEEQPLSDADAAALIASSADADVRAGAPRDLRTLTVVPAQPGRLLRFSGDLLHAVPKPTLSWLTNEEKPKVSAKELRAVLLFNTWQEAPMLPPPNDPPPAAAIEALAALPSPPVCLPKSSWADATLHCIEGADDAEAAALEAPLLGDARRRGCDAPTLRASAPSGALETALLSPNAVHTIAVEGAALSSSSSSSCSAADAEEEDKEEEVVGAAAAVEVDGDEELAIKLGYAEHLEDEFFGGAGDDDEWDDDDDDDDDGGDFWANVAALKALEESQRQQ